LDNRRDSEFIFKIVDRRSDPREIPLIKDTLLKWSRTRAYGLLYADEAVEAYARGDYGHLDSILQEANRIADVGTDGFWFFENMELLFQPDVIKHRTTGFPRLDRLLNNGGPSAKEVVCWLAATNVGKCHSAQTLIIEERLSRIYELGLENGSIIKLRGSREVQTARGTVKVCDLADSDDLIEIPVGDDAWNLEIDETPPNVLTSYLDTHCRKLFKSITPTNRFAEIPFAEVIKDPSGKRVYTPSGFQPVLACEHIKRGPTIKVKIEDGELICDPMHRFIVQTPFSVKCDETINQPEVVGRNELRAEITLAPTTERFAKDLLSSDRLIGYGGQPLSFSVEPGPVTDLYDIQLPAPHSWYTSGVVSHNSILLCNNAISSLKGEGPDGTMGQDVLLITFELDAIKTALRCLAAASGIPINHIQEKHDYIRRTVRQMQRHYKKRFLIHEMPPDECSVNHVYALLDSLKRLQGWQPDVVILDYMDLMVSRNPAYNKDDYTRQKHVANEIRGLAKNENVLVFTATQTNRGGASEEGVADLTKAAESFGKQFSLDYVISLNQNRSDRQQTPPRLRLFVAKNRNGPKHETITCEINYDTMLVKELL
jgi:replicative DNA helicase